MSTGTWRGTGRSAAPRPSGTITRTAAMATITAAAARVPRRAAREDVTSPIRLVSARSSRLLVRPCEWHDPRLGGLCDGLELGTSAELEQHLADVAAYCRVLDMQVVRECAVVHALGHQAEDLPLAWGEAGGEPGVFGPLARDGASPGQELGESLCGDEDLAFGCPVDGTYDVVAGCGFEEVAGRAGFDGGGHGVVGVVGAEEDDSGAGPAFADLGSRLCAAA